MIHALKNIAHICVCVFVCFPCMYTCIICIVVSLEGLELQMVISCHVGAGDQTQVLGKSSQCS